MRLRYSFSSRHTGKIKNIRKQKGKYPIIAQNIIEESDIILEVLDARFPEETRNPEFEQEIIKKGKKIIYILNKTDLINKNKLKEYNYLTPNIAVSCKSHQNISKLRDLIKRTAKTITKPESSEKIIVGIIGYPNTGKSSLINVLIGKSSAGVGSDAGFTKSLQKLKLSPDIFLIDSPGIIPKRQYSSQDTEKIALNTRLGARSYSQVKDPEMVVASIIRSYPNLLEEFYRIDANGDSEVLIEKLGEKKGFLKKGGQVNEDTTARLIIKDWQTGKIKI